MIGFESGRFSTPKGDAPAPRTAAATSNMFISKTEFAPAYGVLKLANPNWLYVINIILFVVWHRPNPNQRAEDADGRGSDTHERPPQSHKICFFPAGSIERIVAQGF
jgi:hypothetical protein